MYFKGFTILSLVVGALALPKSNSHVLHEKRVTKSRWRHKAEALIARDARLPMKIALSQTNLDQGEELLMRVSHPDSEHYGKHYTPNEIIDLFAPEQESIDLVMDWLVSSGLDRSKLKLSRGRNWLQFEATIAEAESLLQTEFKVYEHPDGDHRLGCDEYSLPEHLTRHVDFVTPTIQLDLRRDAAKQKRKLKERAVTPQPIGPTIGTFPPSSDFSPDAAAAGGDLANCGAEITPACLRALYGFPKGRFNLSSIGVLTFTPQAYLQSDLDKFYKRYAKEIPAGYAPILESIDGGVNQQSMQGSEYNSEADLDTEYAIALVYPQSVVVYQIGDLIEFASDNNFLDAVDASYCTYQGGDNPTYDKTYPDPNPGGYKGKDCGRWKPTYVMSDSYGNNEAQYSASYMQRECNEILKLGMAGVTFLTGSGDDGVAGDDAECCVNPGCAGDNAVDANGKVFNPNFLSTCPYVTAVGGTQIPAGGNVTSPEVACEESIRSGGGFSNVFAIPSYQQAAVAAYYKNHAPPYTAAQYNNSQKVRGFPDVSANAAAYAVYQNGQRLPIYGTSASAPTFASIITLINEERANKGKGPVGFINPVLYANPGAFNDITKGRNPGCGTDGFEAVPGWDPVTGLGTPIWEKFKLIFP